MTQIKMETIVSTKNSLKEAIKALKGQGFEHRFFLHRGLIKTPQKFMSVRDLYILEIIPFEDEDFEEANIYGVITKCKQKGYLSDKNGDFNSKLQQLE